MPAVIEALTLLFRVIQTVLSLSVVGAGAAFVSFSHIPQEYNTNDYYGYAEFGYQTYWPGINYVLFVAALSSLLGLPILVLMESKQAGASRRINLYEFVIDILLLVCWTAAWPVAANVTSRCTTFSNPSCSMLIATTVLAAVTGATFFFTTVYSAITLVKGNKHPQEATHDEKAVVDEKTPGQAA